MNKRFYSFCAYRLDTHNQRLLRGGEIITLTLKEFELLFALVENAGDVVSKDALLDAVWKDVSVAEETLTRNISWLRKKLDSADAKKFIETVPKRGYRFLPEVIKSDGSDAALIVEEQTRTHIRIEETVTIADADLALAEIENAALLPPSQNRNLQFADRRRKTENGI